MSKPLTRLLCVLLAVLLGSVAVRADNPVQEYNDAILRYNKKLNAAGFAVGLRVGPAIVGKRTDIKQLREAYAQYLNVVAGIRKEVARLKIPNTDSSRKLANTYERFIKWQEDSFKDKMKEIIHVIEKANPPDKQGQKRIVQIFLRMDKQERAFLKEIAELQRAVARDHKLSSGNP